MKRKRSKIFRFQVVGIIFCILLSFFTSVSAKENNYSNDIVILSNESANLIELKLEELSELKLKKELEELNTTDNKKTILNLEKEIKKIKKELQSLGAEKPSKKFLTKLLEAEKKKMDKEFGILSDWHPSDIIDTFDGAYDVWGYSTTYSGYQLYHLIFEYNGNDPYLAKSDTEKIYDAFSQGSSDAYYWLEETIKVYAEKLVGGGLGLLNPLTQFVPWELLFSSKPSSNEISSTGDALVATLSSLTTQKFVYVYDTLNSEWAYALSTNRVNYAYTFTEIIYKDGSCYHDNESQSNQNVYGDYYSASSDAVDYFESYTYGKTCIDKLAAYSDSNSSDEINMSIFTPTFVAHMTY
jgi:hypothetical protein